MDMQITGSTLIVGIVGTPIIQVKMPGLVNPVFAANQRDVVHIPIDVKPEGLSAFVDLMRAWNNFRGVVVTVPYKQALVPYLDTLTERARVLNAVNVIRRNEDGTLDGDAQDGVGFVAALTSKGAVLKGKSVAVVGSGGVATAIAYSLCEAGVQHIHIQDLDTTKQNILIATLRKAFPAIDVQGGITSVSGLDLLVNATPVGMNGDPNLPLPADVLEPLTATTIVADVVTMPAMTPLLTLAKARGCLIQQGVDMAAAQLETLHGFMGVATV
jgi:shikimate dehydrogenase